MNLSGQDDVPVFERSGNYWNDIGDKYPAPECHPHDRGWVISILYGVTTKTMGAVHEAPNFRLGQQQIKAIIEKYTKCYVNAVDKNTDPLSNLPRVEANTRLLRASKNFANR